MFDKFRLKDALARYKQNFVSTQWGNEKYKWEAVKWFQDNWDVNAKDFPEMLERSLEKTYNLLASNNNFPKGMIIGFAKAAPEEVRAMFLDLFDENKDVFERMNAFKLQSSILLEKYGNGAAQHYQYENAISTYLWLRYPNKYYIYKFGEIKKVAGELESDYQFKKGAYADNIRNFLRLYDEISTALKEDTELVNLLRSQLTDTCYPDPELKTLTIDVGFYISRYIVDEKSEEGIDEKTVTSDNDPASKKRYWIYSPGDGAENWDEFYNTGIMAIGWEALGNLHAFHSKDEMAKKMQEIFSDDSSHKNDAHATWQFANEINPGDIVFAKKGLRLLVGCGVVESDYIFDEHEEHFKNVRKVRWTHKGEWQYPGNAPMKTLTDLTPYPDVVRRLLNLIDGLPDEPVSDDKDAPGYWWLNANPKIWSFSGIAVGETQSYTLYNENGNKRRIFQNFLDAKAGDMIIGYESNPVKQVVALGQITAANDGEKILFEKVESFASPIDYAVLKACPELEQMEYFQNAQGSLFRLTKEEYDFILDIVREANPISVEETIEEYTKDDFLKEVFMTEKRYENLVAVLQNKKNIILQGAPGVGKTFAARRLAWSMMGEKDDNRIEFVQFHQNYSYEDFMMGYKPVEDGFELKYGIFYRFCQKAANQPDKDFFFIIDEINRGNMSKIFGELLMLIERDYRGTKATLAYNGLSFSVPKNLYIIGMMNTADRSLAMIDYALRRRFSFFEVEPGFDSDGFIKYQNALNNETLNELISKVKELNREIALDKSLGKGFCIGHSYFCGKDICTDEWLHSIVDYDILPMLSEYWFDDSNKLQRWENVLQGVFQ